MPILLSGVTFKGGVNMQDGIPIPPAGQTEYTIAGTYSWTAPIGVSSVSVVCIGGGGGSVNSGNDYQLGGGGALAYANNISVTPGNSYTVVVGAVGVSFGGADGGDSSFNGTSCKAGGGKTGPTVGTPSAGGTVIYGTGGAGGNSGTPTLGTNTRGGGGGAGGYSGPGGNGGNPNNSGSSGSGGGGGGGGGGNNTGSENFAAGGGTGIYGEGASGAGGGVGARGQPGSGGAEYSYASPQGNLIIGGIYGGGGVGSYFGTGGTGAVRIIWGTGRAYPSTNTANV